MELLEDGSKLSNRERATDSSAMSGNTVVTSDVPKITWH